MCANTIIWYRVDVRPDLPNTQSLNHNRPTVISQIADTSTLPLFLVAASAPAFVATNFVCLCGAGRSGPLPPAPGPPLKT